MIKMAEITILKHRRRNSKYENYILYFPKKLAEANGFEDKTKCTIEQYGADFLIRVKK